MAIQMRRGQLAQYDKSKMLPGEWGISIDNDSDNQKAFISFAPGVSKEVMMVEDAEEQIAVATAEAIDMATEEAEAWAHGNSFHVNDYASGDGSTKLFTLAETPSSILGVYVDGSSVSAYTLSGKTITFTTAPASGSNNIRVYYTVNTTTDNAKYYKEQAEAVAESIPEDYSKLSNDVDQLKNALTTKAEQDGAYPDLTAGQLLSKNEASDSVPYNFRAVGQDATLEYTDAIVGGTVAWNQLVNSGMTSVTVPNGHKYLSIINSVVSIGTSTGTGISINDATKDNIFELTQMFGSTIADYIYSLEQANAGAGVAWFRKLFPNDYYEYNAGEIVSVQGLSQHVTVGFNQWDEEWEVGSINDKGQNSDWNAVWRSKNYIPVISGGAYYFKATTIARIFYYDAQKNFISYDANPGNEIIVMPNNCCFVRIRSNAPYNAYNHDICINLSDPTRNGEYEPYQKRTYPLDSDLTLRGILKLDSNNQLYADGDRYLHDGTVKRRYGERAYQSGDVTDGSTMITDGTNTVYKLTTPTTEEADPYTTPQIIDPNGTEEFVSTSIVPVGHESRYPLDIAGRLDKILTMPTANGTYTLRATVNNGAVTYAWVST